MIAAGLFCLLISACAAGAGEPEHGSAMPSPTDPNACPVTVPPQPAFVPPEPYPSEPPFGQVWYGTAELWTILDANGDVWRDLPVAKDGSVGDKTLWFSDRFSTASDEDFTGNADITLTAERLDGPAHKVVATRPGPLPADGGVPSFNRDIKNFMLLGLVLPKPGCWEVTASYRGAELAYVLQVEG
jgi:hypothetical protein